MAGILCLLFCGGYLRTACLPAGLQSASYPVCTSAPAVGMCGMRLHITWLPSAFLQAAVNGDATATTVAWSCSEQVLGQLGPQH
jgi:hypothetical protein